MFKIKFNELAVSIEKFILDELNRPELNSVNEQIKYYKQIVDDYYYLKLNLESVINNLNEDLFPDLAISVNNTMDLLNVSFDKYKSEFVVLTYIQELENFQNQNTLYERLYKFEKSLISSPLIKIDSDVLQDILKVAQTFAQTAPKLYFFMNNPFEIDEDLNLVIPRKIEYTNIDEFVTAVYNYTYEIYNTYKINNEQDILSLNSLEIQIKEQLFEFGEKLRLATKNKYHAEYGTTPTEYFDNVTIIVNDLNTYLKSIIDMGVYRFYSLVSQINEFQTQFNILIDYYVGNNLYQEQLISNTFNLKLFQLHEIVGLLEDGKINLDKDYIFTDLSIKEIVDDIIVISRDNKKTIKYTEKYNVSGISKELTFEFYQTNLFLESIKAYYYELMTKNIYRYSNISIDDYGDGSVNEYRIQFKSDLAKYTAFMSQEFYFMNEFEIFEYVTQVESVQTILKQSALIFFDASVKSSPLTYQHTIEKHYKLLLASLVSDLDILKSKNLDIIQLNVDTNRIEALQKLRLIETHINSLVNIIDVSRKYVFLDMTDFIDDTIYNLYNNFYISLKESFDKEEYLKVKSDYDYFYKHSVFDFNMLYSLEKLSSTTELLFDKFKDSNNIFITEQFESAPVPRDNDNILFLQDLFDDETFKVLRNEIFSQLDNFYEYVISVRENEKPFLINERNLKKVYFDNQLVKLNYIRIYDKIMTVEQPYTELDSRKYLNQSWFTDYESIISTFKYKQKLDTLILNQNRVLSDISRMIIEYSTDNNHLVVDITQSYIDSIIEYNQLFDNDIVVYSETLNLVISMVSFIDLDEKKKELIDTHTKQWTDIIHNNLISPPEKISYNEMETIVGNIPFKVELEAKTETINVGTDNLGETTIVWDFGGYVLEGNEVSYTFFEEGIHQVRCEMTYENGLSTTRFIEFEINGPTNTNIVKSDVLHYTPIQRKIEQPKISYFDPKKNKQITIPLGITGDIEEMIKSGSITVTDDDNKLLEEKVGLIVLGFDGVEFAGPKFEYEQIFSEDFVLPEEAEFLFDFKVSDPIVGNSVIDISTSKFIDYMVKIPKERAHSVYEIEDANDFTTYGDDIMEVIVGDLILMKNKMGRFCITEISSIKEITDPDAETYYFEIDFSFHINISLNIYEQMIFKPLETDYVVPTLIFKTDVRELFNSLIVRLETLEQYKQDLETVTDNEKRLTTESAIRLLEEENNEFYLFEEYNRLHAKIISLKSMLSNLDNFDTSSNSSTDIINMSKVYATELSLVKSFSQYIGDINVYDFRKSIIDLPIMISMYEEQLMVMDIMISTYNYKSNDFNYYLTKLNTLTYSRINVQIFENKSYTEQLVILVKELRSYLFKIKLVINFPIMSAGKYIKVNAPFERTFMNEETGEYEQGSEIDLYLLNKKLELQYGYEANKVEDGAMYETFVEDIISIQKENFGVGLSQDDIDSLSNYIQVVEDRVVEEYDDFFMIPFWIDYLEKLN